VLGTGEEPNHTTARKAWSSRKRALISASWPRRNLVVLVSYQKCFSLLHQLMEVGEGCWGESCCVYGTWEVQLTL
jgi:hypothetical protein